MDGRTVELIVVGYVVSLPVVVWAIAELTRIPDDIYDFTAYRRSPWIATIAAGYACFGIGGVLMVVAWVKSPDRAELHDELAYAHRWDAPVAPEPPPPLPTPVRQLPRASRSARRRERQRRQRFTAIAVSIPVLLAVAATALRIS